MAWYMCCYQLEKQHITTNQNTDKTNFINGDFFLSIDSNLRYRWLI